YAGQTAWFTWKFLGDKKILATFHADKFPVEWCPGGGDFVYCDNWEPRDVWVVEGVSKQDQYAYGKRVLFIDKETYFVAYSDIYDKAGQLWKVWLNQWGFRNKAAPGYGDTYDAEMPFLHSISMVDMQLTHATRAALPSAKYPNEAGWYFNQGAKTGLTRVSLTIAHRRGPSLWVDRFRAVGVQLLGFRVRGARREPRPAALVENVWRNPTRSRGAPL